MANEALHISFDNGFGTLGNAFNVGAPSNGEVVLTGNSALMEWASGPSSGHGYGTYTVEAKLDGNWPGAALLFWPGDNKWPGAELDLAEIAEDGSGRIYGAVHWNENGEDGYSYQIYDGVYTGSFHAYTMVWEPGKISVQVDGQTKAVFTENVPADFDHGGMNSAIGFLNRTPGTSVTVRDVTYTPLGEAAPQSATPQSDASHSAAAAASDPILAMVPEQSAASSAGSDTGSVSVGGWDWPADASGVIDWNALAAQVHANQEATGQWFI